MHSWYPRARPVNRPVNCPMNSAVTGPVTWGFAVTVRSERVGKRRGTTTGVT
jgi:hypothetical protein